MPSITTMVTDKALSMISGDTTSSLEDTINEAFGSMGQLQTGLEGLSQGNAAIAGALTQIKDVKQSSVVRCLTCRVAWRRLRKERRKLMKLSVVLLMR